MKERMRSYSFALFQMKQNPQTHGLKFFSHEFYIKRMGDKKVDLSLYSRVYEGTVAGKNMHDALEELFRQFNLEHPQDFYGHSLSVSDLVMLVSAKESVKNRVHPFYCDSWGWKEVKTKGVVRRGA